MAKDTEADVVIEALDHLLEVQEEHSKVLTSLQQRPIPDLQGLVRRLEEVADAVDRIPPAPASLSWLQYALPGMLLVGLLVGWFSCWLTVRWLPDTMLPPGFAGRRRRRRKGASNVRHGAPEAGAMVHVSAARAGGSVQCGRGSSWGRSICISCVTTVRSMPWWSPRRNRARRAALSSRTC